LARPVVRQRGHHQDADNADHDLHPDSAGNLDQHEMCSKGQEYAGQPHSALRFVSRRGVIAGQNYDDRRIDGYQSS
jgi:hypothetical protein